ncbi:MAG: hypothetical protein JXA22_09785 [Candidatus Thermoplasmatota archaeon]|nr:hypothetical protein [Candidatus Thermoplasmatota archaeon]
MVLDMESEFYKLAHGIVSKPKTLYKMAAIGPRSGRLNIMGADGYVVVGSSLLRALSRGPEGKAYELGRTCGEEVFGNLVKEFDEEVNSLPPKKLMELGTLFLRSLGWGDLEVLSLDPREGTTVIRAKRTVELRYKKAKHHMLTCGLLSSVATLSFRKEVHGKVEEAGETFVTFSIS